MPTKIEWATESWNPVTGCTPISEGCRGCYAKRMAQRLAGRYGYPRDDPFKVTFHPDQIEKPLKWNKPRRIFVCSMGDIFHPAVDPWWIDNILDICLAAPQHTYMFLTKRPENIRLKLSGSTGNQLEFMSTKAWIGVTLENWKHKHRMKTLINTPCALRFISAEPMLSVLEVDRYLGTAHADDIDGLGYGKFGPWRNGIDWVICGAETGPKKRPMDLDWAKSLRDQCQAAGVPFFFKKDSNGNHELDGQVWEQFPEVENE